ncbi:hypothetical protein [Streptomyces sp. NPDC059063]|uniref:hypothetical protein n=1 Tax=unclassified Streptomyces TaxID=2593676 RepID=UPI00369A692E
MHRSLVHAIAWSLATGAAVTLSWWGVHTVMAGTAYDPPRAVPLAAGDGAGDSLSSSTHRPEPTPRTKPSRTPVPSPAKDRRSPRPPQPSKIAKHSTSPQAPARPAPRHPGASGSVRGYNTEGGRVVFDLGETSAKLVSVRPAAGWSMQMWTAPTWIRVEFTTDTDRVSVFCTWHDHAPRVEVDTY